MKKMKLILLLLFGLLLSPIAEAQTNSTDPHIVCFGSTHPYRVDYTENAGAGTTGSTYAWTVTPASPTVTPFVGSITGNNTNSISINWGATPVGTYQVQVIETNTLTSCPGTPITLIVDIRALPVVTSPPAICVGATSSLSPATGGTWTSSDPTIATVTNAGAITGIAAGSVTFTFTDAASGCSSTTSAVTINALPVVSAAASVCVGGNITLSPTTGGTWLSSDVTKATVTNAGLVTGIAAGSATFTFTSTATGCSNSTSSVTVNPAPIVSAPASVCIGGTITLSPTTGGTWTSSDPTKATVDNAGLVTGVAAGSVTFTFTATASLCSSTTSAVTINAAPIVSAAASVCVGSSFTLSPTSGGTWLSSDPTKATVTNAGLVTGVAIGTVTFTFTSTATGCSNTTSSVAVNGPPAVSAGASVCVGGTLTLSPTSGGTWLSSDATRATVNNAGLVTGVAAGSVTFTFTSTATGCSNTTSSVTVNAAPIVSAAASVCIGSTITLSPTIGGTWTSNDPTKATVTNAGLVTGIAAGSTTFTFTETASGCSSTTSIVTINAVPIVSASSSVCVGSTISISPTSGGTWLSNDITVATVSNSGVITGVAAGSTTFTFTSTATGCSNTTSSVTVNPLPTISISTAPACAVDLLTYSVSVTVSAGAVTSTAGTVTNPSLNNWTISGIIAGTDIILTLTSTCVNTLSITAPNCSCPVIAAPTIPVSTSYCTGGTISSVSATVPAGFTVDWYSAAVGGTLLQSGTTGGVNTFTPTAPGTNTYYAVAREISTGCLSSTRTPATVTQNPLPTILAFSDVTICAGASTSLSATGGVSYTWLPTTGLSPISGSPVNAAPASTQTYTVTGTDSNGCINTDSVLVTVTPLPTTSPIFHD